ncbi:hypothetical protein [Halostagnicola kamekurae]|uniref:Uncharacterized protein n=1 Tax=Halostagnicola kamekurae TaxID=619731 RepID=A0A1I6PPD5_9EURY|nr:hypothetical protein [Halostagnicola kamekurae]SFS41915.1 hypothetical protein SAMN04488556_0692 [Halostagnicola kamekurae]
MSIESPQPTETESIEKRALNEMLETRASQRNVLRGIGATGTAAAIANESAAIESAAIVQEQNRTIQFGEWTELIGWGFEDGTMQIAITTERPVDVVVVDSVAGFGEEGAVRPPTSQTSLESGTHVVTMPVETFRGAHSVTVNIDGASVRLSSKMEEEEPDDPLQYFGGISGLFWGIGMTTGLAGAAAAYVVYREDSGVVKA